jgi:exopolyphosphatase/pppGpp-phosphohydrolase
MGENPFGLLELGSNSLKFYLVASPKGPNPSIRTYKVHWRVAHDFFLTGRLSEGSIAEVVESLRRVPPVAEGLRLSDMLAVATGVFREIDNVDELSARVKAQTGVRVRVISGEDEAKLMAKDFSEQAGGDPAFLIDLGGATMEWVWFKEGRSKACGSLPLGAIRNEYAFRHLRDEPERYLEESAAHCDRLLAPLPFEETTRAVATGGTAKALARCAGSDAVPIDTLKGLAARVAREGPPPDLKPSRQAVFLPGLVILWRVAARCGASSLTYGKTCVRNGMAGRLIRLLGTHRRQDLHATLLLNTRELRRGAAGR